MADDITTVISALIGALVGSLGSIVIGDLLKRKAEKIALQQKLINRYLLQLQDAIEALWYRLDTLEKRNE